MATMREHIRADVDRSLAGPEPRTCLMCGEVFTTMRVGAGRGLYCSAECRNEANRYTVVPAKDTRRGETAAILKSETKGRVKPMTEAEFIAALVREERLLKDAGAPLIRLDMGGSGEKQERIAAHMARTRVEVTQEGK
jgi:hypothetical protein